MQQALPYRPWPAAGSPIGRILPDFETLNNKTTTTSTSSSSSSVKRMVGENAVLVLGRRGCCMSHVMKRLLLGLGVNPAVCEVDEEDETAVVEEVAGGTDGGVQFPVVYIGGRLFGGLERLMGAHITGELVPVLKKAGGLWL